MLFSLLLNDPQPRFVTQLKDGVERGGTGGAVLQNRSDKSKKWD